MNLYEKALNIIQERGLAKETSIDGAGHVCIRGALCLAMNDCRERGPAFKFVDQAASRLFPTRAKGSTSVEFNDHPATTQQDVELVLQHAAREWTMLHESVH
jgi:hypothetical protein